MSAVEIKFFDTDCMINRQNYRTGLYFRGTRQFYSEIKASTYDLQTKISSHTVEIIFISETT